MRSSQLAWIPFFSVILIVGCSDAGDRPDASQLTVDQCTSASDVALLVPPDAGAADGGTISDIGFATKACVIGPCLDITLTQDIEGSYVCINECLDGTEYAGLSQGCRDCYIEAFWCGQEHCTVPCLGSDEALCEACLADFCSARTYECVGYVPN